MNFKKYLLQFAAIFSIIFFIFFAVVFLRYRSWTTEHGPAQKLVTYLSQITKSDFKYQKLEWHLLPFPAVSFSQPLFLFKSGLHHQLKAESLELRLNLIKLLAGEVGFSRLHLRKGEWQGQVELPKGVHDFLVKNIDLRTGALSSGKPVKLYMSGDSGGRRKAVVIHGELKLPPIEDPSLARLGFKVQVLARNFRLEGTPEWELMGWIPSSGMSDFLMELETDSGAESIAFSGDAGLHDLVLNMPGPIKEAPHKAGNVQLKFAGRFNPATDEFKLTECSTDLPFTKLNLQGTYLPHRREFRSMSFNFSGMKLDDLPKYVPDFKNKVPVFIGFSGMSDFTVSLSGYSNHLKIYTDMDLTQALFTYGKFFQKPKGKQLRIKSDLDWNGKLISGEFSGNFESLTFKGNLPEWRSSGDIKLNVITNVFAAEQLMTYVPFLANYDFSGNMKLFASFQGKLQGAESLEKMFHINFQNGQVLRHGTKSGLHDINFDFDFGPMIMESKEFSFSLGGAAFKGFFRGLHPEKNPQWEGQVESAKAISSEVWKEGIILWSGTDAVAQQNWLQGLHPLIQKLIANEDPVESLIARFSLANRNFKVDSFKFRVFDGQVKGLVDFQPMNRGQKINLEINGSDMDSKRFFKFFGADQAGIEGRLSWDAHFQGKRLADDSKMDLNGPATFSVTKGILSRFNVVQALEQMDVLKKATQTPSDQMAFDLLDAKGQLDEGHLKLDRVTLKNSDIQIDAQGDMSSEGILNLRMKTWVDAGYFRYLFPKRADNFMGNGDASFGPVTLLASGPLNELILKPDPQSAVELAGRFARKKTQVLSRYF